MASKSACSTQSVLNLDGAKLKIKTTWAGRKTESPLFSISKGGMTYLNKAFHEKWFAKHKKALYIQAVSMRGVDYILVSKEKKAHYYKLTAVHSGGFSCTVQGFATAFGKKGLTMRYLAERVATTDASVYAFKIKYVANDLVVSQESADFELHKNQIA